MYILSLINNLYSH